MKRTVDSWHRTSRAVEAETAPSPAGDGRPDEGGRRRWWRLNDRQMQFVRYLILLLAVGVVLMSLNSGEVRDAGTRPADEQSPTGIPMTVGSAGPAADFAREMERQLSEALLQLHGVGRVHVAVTVSAGSEKIVAEHVTTERRISDGVGIGDEAEGRAVIDERTSAQPVLVRSDQKRQEGPIVLMERTPVVQGVVVVADAAADSRRRYEITRAVMTLMDLPAHRVYVLPQRL